MKTIATLPVRLALIAAIALWTIAALLPARRPAAVPASAPAAQFSAERAMTHVGAIAQQPHPLGSAEHDRVRDYVRSELARLDVDPQLQAGIGRFDYRARHIAEHVENIVARLPGTANTRAVMLATHYDSARLAPGAADAGHAVAVLLETLRTLRSGPPLRNDVIFLLTDGEERGLLGAELFMREHPWRGDPGVVLNFEARGTSGESAMFETSEGNEWIIRGLQAAVPQAFATSMAYEVYRRMPNGTDLSVFKAGGLAGMNFAFIDHPEFYHQPQDDVAHLDRASVQEQGRYALQLTRRFGNEDLRERRSGDAVYFPTRLTPLIVYPLSWVRPLAWMAVAGLLAAVWTARRRGVRGRWMGAPLLLLAALLFLAAPSTPGVTYLLQWPLLAGIAAYALLVTAPETLGAGWRGAAMVLLMAPSFLLVLAPLPMLVVALGIRTAAPVIAAAAVVILIGILPQFALICRRAR